MEFCNKPVYTNLSGLIKYVSRATRDWEIPFFRIRLLTQQYSSCVDFFIYLLLILIKRSIFFNTPKTKFAIFSLKFSSIVSIYGQI